MRRESCSSRVSTSSGRSCCRRRGDAVLLLIIAVPLHLARGDRRMALGQRAEGHLPHRQHLEALVADHAHIELAPFDVLLDQRIRVGLLVDERDAFLETALVRDDRGMRDAERGIVGGGFHEHREAQALRQSRCAAAREHHELRSRHAVIGEQLLGEHLVPREQHAARVAARVRLVQSSRKATTC